MSLLTRRELTAAAVAPLLAPLGYWLALTLYGLARWQLDQRKYGVRLPSLGEIVRPIGPILLVGAPVAWAAAALAGIPVYLVVRSQGVPLAAEHRVILVVAAAAIGFLVALLMAPGLRGEIFSIPFPLWLGALLGAAVGVAFLWLLAR